MKSDELSAKIAVVTGAASGIGRALALACAKRGATLAVCDVDEQGLDETARAARALGRRVLTMKVDVSKRDQVEAFADRTHAELGAATLLVNNAGVGLSAGFLDTTLADWDWIVGINLMGVVYGCHFFVPRMVAARQGGHVVNISSSAGIAPSQILSAYSTTKTGVLGLSEALRAELKPHGIGVTAACPGAINTPIARTTVRRGWQNSKEGINADVHMMARRNYSPERAAEAILAGLDTERTVLPVAPEAWALYYTKRFLPGAVEWFDERMVALRRRGRTARARPGYPTVK